MTKAWTLNFKVVWHTECSLSSHRAVPEIESLVFHQELMQLNKINSYSLRYGAIVDLLNTMEEWKLFLSIQVMFRKFSCLTNLSAVRKILPHEIRRSKSLWRRKYALLQTQMDMEGIWWAPCKLFERVMQLASSSCPVTLRVLLMVSPFDFPTVFHHPRCIFFQHQITDRCYSAHITVSFVCWVLHSSPRNFVL